MSGMFGELGIENKLTEKPKQTLLAMHVLNISVDQHVVKVVQLRGIIAMCDDLGCDVPCQQKA